MNEMFDFGSLMKTERGRGKHDKQTATPKGGCCGLITNERTGEQSFVCAEAISALHTYHRDQCAWY